MKDILERYPMMKEHVGDKYIPGGPTFLLLIGESHYLPKYSTQHLAPETWYSSDAATLNEEEKGWINTSGIIRGCRANNFRGKTFSIYRNAFREINDNGPKYSDYKQVADDVVYYNYFQRPARTRESLLVSTQDVQIAEQRFREVATQYQPAAIVFLSIKAFNHCVSCRELGVRVVSTPHPGCSHWNRVSNRYGGKRGRDQLGNLVRQLWSDATGEMSQSAGSKS